MIADDLLEKAAKDLEFRAAECGDHEEAVALRLAAKAIRAQKRECRATQDIAALRGDWHFVCDLPEGHAGDHRTDTGRTAPVYHFWPQEAQDRLTGRCESNFGHSPDENFRCEKLAGHGGEHGYTASRARYEHWTDEQAAKWERQP